MADKMGKGAKQFWQFLDGKKTFIWCAVLVAKHFFPNVPIWAFVDAAAAQIGWHDIAPAVDPDQLITWITLGIALGHKMHKALGGDVKNLEWKTIGTVPEIKDLESLEKLPEAPIPPAVSNPNPKLTDVRSKKAIPVGTIVLMSDGNKGVIVGTKEQSGSGYVYSVAEVV